MLHIFLLKTFLNFLVFFFHFILNLCMKNIVVAAVATQLAVFGLIVSIKKCGYFLINDNWPTPSI